MVVDRVREDRAAARYGGRVEVASEAARAHRRRRMHERLARRAALEAELAVGAASPEVLVLGRDGGQHAKGGSGHAAWVSWSRFRIQIEPGVRSAAAGQGALHDQRRRLDEVVAFDASERMAEIATKTIGQPALRLSFEEMAFRNEFDGVWACASLLHVPDSELESVLARIVRALKENGVLYMSFKYGTGERVAGGRRFTDMTEASIRETLSDLPELALLRTWRTSDLRPGRESESWLNALARKTRV